MHSGRRSNAGQIQLTFLGTTGIIPFIQTGKLRPIGVVSPQRIPELSDVPKLTSPAEFALFIAAMKEEGAKVIKATGVTIN
jgi:hypothetical protein